MAIRRRRQWCPPRSAAVPRRSPPTSPPPPPPPPPCPTPPPPPPPPPRPKSPRPRPRPAGLREGPGRLAERTPAPRAQVATGEDEPAERSFLETVFGTKPSTGPQLAYAPLDTSAVDASPRRSLGLGPAPTPSGTTAVYDISARTVTLPNGERLEAHSGLGASQDDPRFVHLRMRGATPPGTPDRTDRERSAERRVGEECR